MRFLRLHQKKYSNRRDKKSRGAPGAGNSRHRVEKANASKEECAKKSREFVVNPNEE